MTIQDSRRGEVKQEEKCGVIIFAQQDFQIQERYITMDGKIIDFSFGII